MQKVVLILNKKYKIVCLLYFLYFFRKATLINLDVMKFSASWSFWNLLIIFSRVKYWYV